MIGDEGDLLFRKPNPNTVLPDQIHPGEFPGGPVVKNPPCNAGDTGSILGWGTKILHATEQLSPRAASTEPWRHNWRFRVLQRKIWMATATDLMQPNQ